MEYGRFMALNAIIVISAAVIYVGCRRSYSIYFFEVLTFHNMYNFSARTFLYVNINVT